MENLLQKQKRFAAMAAELIRKANQMGFGVTLGEAWRTPEQAKLNAQKKTGIKNSLHCDRLAIDINLFADDVYLTNSESYQQLGEYWESIGGTWGGRFGDGNHFSLEHNGRK